MTQGSARRYRILPETPTADTQVWLDLTDLEPIRVRTEAGTEELKATLSGIRPGYIVEATVAWSEGVAHVETCSVTEPTLFTFADGVTNLFEVALDTWESARQSGAAVESTVTYSNDGQPNGALYTFAAQPGERDLFAEFRDGRRPLEPLLEKVSDSPPYEVFVFRPATHDFILVYVVLAKNSMLADTVRDTYDCPRPAEPLLSGTDADN